MYYFNPQLKIFSVQYLHTKNDNDFTVTETKKMDRRPKKMILVKNDILLNLILLKNLGMMKMYIKTTKNVGLERHRRLGVIPNFFLGDFGFCRK